MTLLLDYGVLLALADALGLAEADALGLAAGERCGLCLPFCQP